MNELELKYGCNPNQKPSRIFMEEGGDGPAGGGIVQARIPGGRRGGPAHGRDVKKDLLGG